MSAGRLEVAQEVVQGSGGALGGLERELAGEQQRAEGVDPRPAEAESGNEGEGLERSRSEEEWWFISRKTDEPISAEKKDNAEETIHV